MNEPNALPPLTTLETLQNAIAVCGRFRTQPGAPKWKRDLAEEANLLLDECRRVAPTLDAGNLTEAVLTQRTKYLEVLFRTVLRLGEVEGLRRVNPRTMSDLWRGWFDEAESIQSDPGASDWDLGRLEALRECSRGLQECLEDREGR